MDSNGEKNTKSDSNKAQSPTLSERTTPKGSVRAPELTRQSQPNLSSEPRVNVGRMERTISVMLGALILFFIRRKLLVYGGVLFTAAYLLYRGISGRCRLYEEIGFDTSDVKLSDIDFSEFDVSDLDASALRSAEREGHRSEPGADAAREGGSAQSASQPDVREQLDDEVDEAMFESFPASDPPSSW
jgi:hypothetical protein